MFSHKVSAISRNLFRRTFAQPRALNSTAEAEDTEKDPAPLFFREDVQNMLNTMVRPDEEKVFRNRKYGAPIKNPEYRFMTDVELESAKAVMKEKMTELLQMPPVLKKRKERTEVLSKDPALQGYDTAKYVFTDITYGIPDRERLIYVREPEGVLRDASWEERHRLNQIYFPHKGREIEPPKMFYGAYLDDLLKREEYEFILDRACVQYDPDDPEYHRITEAIYSNVNKTKNFNILRSTRHYGPLVFHLAWTNNIDNLLLENIKTENLEDGVLLIKLLHLLHPNPSREVSDPENHYEFILHYIENEAANKRQLTQAIRMYKEMHDAKSKAEEDIKKAHGH